MAAAARLHRDSRHRDRRPGGLRPGIRAHRMGRPRDPCRTFPRRLPRSVRAHRRRRRDARVGRHHRVLHIAVPPTGDPVWPQDRLRHLRTARARGIPRAGGARMKHAALLIETPEGVTFSYELATPVIRAFAWVVDAVVLGGISYAITQVTAMLRIVSQDWATGLGAI